MPHISTTLSTEKAEKLVKTIASKRKSDKPDGNQKQDAADKEPVVTWEQMVTQSAVIGILQSIKKDHKKELAELKKKIDKTTYADIASKYNAPISAMLQELHKDMPSLWTCLKIKDTEQQDLHLQYDVIAEAEVAAINNIGTQYTAEAIVDILTAFSIEPDKKVAKNIAILIEFAKRQESVKADSPKKAKVKNTPEPVNELTEEKNLALLSEFDEKLAKAVKEMRMQMDGIYGAKIKQMNDTIIALKADVEALKRNAGNAGNANNVESNEPVDSTFQFDEKIAKAFEVLIKSRMCKDEFERLSSFKNCAYFINSIRNWSYIPNHARVEMKNPTEQELEYIKQMRHFIYARLKVAPTVQQIVTTLNYNATNIKDHHYNSYESWFNERKYEKIATPEKKRPENPASSEQQSTPSKKKRPAKTGSSSNTGTSINVASSIGNVGSSKASNSTSVANNVANASSSHGATAVPEDVLDDNDDELNCASIPDIDLTQQDAQDENDEAPEGEDFCSQVITAKPSGQGKTNNPSKANEQSKDKNGEASGSGDKKKKKKKKNKQQTISIATLMALLQNNKMAEAEDDDDDDDTEDE